ncbi:MAG: hypothetical protein WC548_02765 [Candidatus Pacearchaeota archaeon]
MKKGRTKKENIELAEEHIKIAEDLVNEDSSEMGGEELEKLKNVELDLEKAEAELDELEEIDEE